MKKLFTIFFSLLFCTSILSQEATKVDEFGNLPCDHTKGLLDSVKNSLEGQPKSKIYIIYYTGKIYSQSIYDEKTETYKQVFLPPRINEAEMIIKNWTEYLTVARAISKNKIVLINGGFREEHTLEIWMVPKNAKSPEPTPTLTRKDIKFRKGRAKYVECST